jgi:hypothetical protein
VVQNRQDFTKRLVNILDTGACDDRCRSAQELENALLGLVGERQRRDAQRLTGRT